MPAMDKTGPFGTGKMGRGRGKCQQANAASLVTGRSGGGNGNGNGMGRGQGCRRGNGRDEPLSIEGEIAMLEERLLLMRSRLSELKQNKDGV